MASASYDGTLKLWDLAAADRARNADKGGREAAAAAAARRMEVGGRDQEDHRRGDLGGQGEGGAGEANGGGTGDGGGVRLVFCGRPNTTCGRVWKRSSSAVSECWFVWSGRYMTIWQHPCLCSSGEGRSEGKVYGICCSNPIQFGV